MIYRRESTLGRICTKILTSRVKEDQHKFVYEGVEFRLRFRIKPTKNYFTLMRAKDINTTNAFIVRFNVLTPITLQESLNQFAVLDVHSL